jgi:hypothetical protein
LERANAGYAVIDEQGKTCDESNIYSKVWSKGYKKEAYKKSGNKFLIAKQ